MPHWSHLFICAFGCVFLIFISLSETKKPSVGLVSRGNYQTESNSSFNSTGHKHTRGLKHIQHSTNRTRIPIGLNGPNVCGTRCCPGWIVHPKTKKCTKPKCAPRCHNRAMCRKQTLCQCLLGSQHCKQNRTTSSSEITPTSVTTAETTPTYRTTPSSLPPTQATTDPKSMGKYSVHWKPLSLKEAQVMLMRKVLVRAVGGNKIANILLKHIKAESNRFKSCNCTEDKTSTKDFYTQHGQYKLIYTPAAERIKVLFTPTICRLRCSNGQCTNYCERGNITTLYSNEDATRTSGFRVFLCPMLCKNGGVCIHKDRCLCPSNFTGKFCHIPVSPTSSSSNEIEKLPSSANVPASQGLMHSEYVLPLQSRQQNHTNGSPMVTVRVHHPPEATVKIHQVVKVTSGSSSETVVRSSGLSGSRGNSRHSSTFLADRAEVTPPLIQAQTFRGDSVYTEASGFKYCFREVHNGQCSSPLPGLRSQETCCRGDGIAWGIKECTLCPLISGSGTSGERSCPKGFERINGTQCVDINECLQPGFCENGKCVNTRGSYSCVCKPAFILDASRGICISQKVISEEKDQCFRIVSQGSCSLPILKNITKQICCCSRVGKAWGRKCEACPYFGSGEFKEICPAGPGYHYSPNTLKLNHRVTEPLNPSVISQTNHTSTTVTKYDTSVLQSTTRNEAVHNQRPTRPQSSTISHNVRIQQSSSSQRQPLTSEVFIIQSEPQLNQHRQAGGSASSTSQPSREHPHVFRPQTSRPSASRHNYPPVLSSARPPPPRTDVFRPQTSRPSVSRHNYPPNGPLPVPSTARPHPPRTDSRVCESNPQICGPGRCIDLAVGKHTCVCNPGFILNSQAGRCQDINECLMTHRPCSAGQCENTVGSFRCVCPSGYRNNAQQNLCSDIDECRLIPNPCTNGHCENTIGSFRCVCRTGYKLQNNTCTDIDECVDPLRCPGKECINTQGSYSCVSCKPGFGLLNGQCSDIDECRQRPSLCSNARCENTPGSYRCVCSKGFKLQGNTCTDVNECDDALQCPGQGCINTLGSYRCVSCGPGFVITNRRCTDIDECGQVPAPCANGRCENTLGSYRCVCHTGYKLQDNKCTDINECENHLQCRGQLCVNTPGSFRCTSCGAGYSFHNGQCTDVDECAQNTRLCANGRCENTPGSYHCVCRPGFRLEANTCTDVNECENELQCPGQKCVNSIGSFKCVSCSPGFKIVNGQCQDVDECSQTPSPCSNSRCENTPGSFTCVCRSGFRLHGNTCTDVDECENSGICGPKSVCVNMDGSYRCECLPGFRATGPGRQCRDINECSEGEFCFPRGECVNTEGSYKCVCSQGYITSANGTLCQDVDECARAGVCEDGRCTNTDGSFVCHCKTGFTANPEKTACLDVDECVDTGGSVCGSQRCENTIGSFRCFITCEPGYSLTGTGECVDINECANESVCGHHMFCRNLIGTYQCICDQGYETAPDGRSCVDINECAVMVGVCGAARCWNVEGSFTCECESRQEEFDPLTRQCVTTGSGSGSSSRLPQPGEKIECYSSVDQSGQCSVLSSNTTVEECCCTVGRAWGIRCQYTLCPQAETSEFQTMCPSGRGYVTSAVGAFSYRDVDECKLFDPELCKGGVCVNNIPGYSCYCPSGYYYDSNLLECVDNNECENEDTCLGGLCVNTLGSFYCTCEPPSVLDNTQRFCVNNSGLAVGEDLSFCWQHVTADLMCQRLLPRVHLTFSQCCCLHGEAWGLHCALCPRRDTEEYEELCSTYGPPPNSPRYIESYPPWERGSYRTPYVDTDYPEIPPDYTDYEGPGRRSGLRTQPVDSYTTFVTPGLGRYYDEEDYDSAAALPFRPDPRTGRFYGSRFIQSPLSEGDEDDESWRRHAPFPPFTDRSPGSERPRRVYERRYESFASLPEEECGILQGCENGRCVRVGEGYTCDCYDGYQLNVASMTCLDVDECEDPTFPECINARCENTEGSYRCVCLRGFIVSRRPNYCIPA